MEKGPRAVIFFSFTGKIRAVAVALSVYWSVGKLLGGKTLMSIIAKNRDMEEQWEWQQQQW